MDVKVINNAEEKRFETTVDGSLALLEYEVTDKTMTLVHTEVPNELEGRGLGSKLVKFALEYAKSHDLAVVPRCPFVRSYIGRHQEYAGLVSR